MSRPALRSALIGRADEHFSNAYFLQYVSLMFILLTFTIGSFRLQDAPAATEPAAPVEPAANSQRKIGEMPLEQLFEPSGAIEGTSAEALAGFLSSHDVDAAIRLIADDSFAKASSRSITLAHHLVDRGVPPGAFSITIRPTGHPAVEFFSAEP